MASERARTRFRGQNSGVRLHGTRRTACDARCIAHGCAAHGARRMVRGAWRIACGGYFAMGSARCVAHNVRRVWGACSRGKRLRQRATHGRQRARVILLHIAKALCPVRDSEKASHLSAL